MLGESKVVGVCGDVSGALLQSHAAGDGDGHLLPVG